MNEMDPLGSPGEEQAARGNPLESLLLPLLRHRYLILFTTLVGTAGGVFLGVIQPNSYASSGQVLVLLGEREQSTVDTAVAGNSRVVPHVDTGAVRNEIGILSDFSVFERVAKKVTPDVILEPYDPFAFEGPDTPVYYKKFHEFQAWWFQSGRKGKRDRDPESRLRKAAQALMKRTKIVQEPYSSIISVSYATHDPEVAKKVVAAFLEAFQERHDEFYSRNSRLAYNFLKKERERVSQEVDRLKSNLATVRTECGVYDYHTQSTNLLNSIHDLQQQKNQDERRLEELSGNLEYLNARIKEAPLTVRQPVTTTPATNPLLTAAQDRVRDLQTAYDKLLASMTPNATQVVQKKAALEEAKRKLAAIPPTLPRDTVMQEVPNPERTTLIQKRDDVLQEKKGLEQAKNVRDRRIAKLEEDLRHVETCHVGLEQQQMAVDRAQAQLTEINQATERAHTKTILDKESIVNLQIVQDPTTPFEKAGPNRFKLVAMGAFLGLFLGCSLAFVLGVMDRSLRLPSDVERYLGTRLLVSVPESASWKRACARAARG